MNTIQSQFQIPKLTGEENFLSWKFRLETVLQSQDLKDVLTENVPVADDERKAFIKRDSECRTLILCSVSDEIVSVLLNCTTAREVWNSLSDRFQGNIRRRGISVRNSINRVKMKNEENWSQYILRIETMWNEAKMLGIDVEEDEVIGAIIQGLPQKYNIVALQIEAMTNPKIDDVRRILKMNADREGIQEKYGPSKAYKIYTGQTWNNRRNGDDQEVKHNQYDERRREYDRNKDIVCYSCRRRGHRQRECWNNRNKENPKDVEPRNLGNRSQKARMAKDEPKQEERKSEKTFCIRTKEPDDENNKAENEKSEHHQKIFNDQKMAEKVQEAQEVTNSYPEETEMKIKEAQAVLHEQYSEELIKVREEAEERVMEAEMEVEKMKEQLMAITCETEEKVNKEIEEAMQEKQHMEHEMEIFTARFEKFFSKVFPNIPIPKTGENKICLEVYENEIESYLGKLENSAKNNSKSIEDTLKKLEESEAEKLTFEVRIEKYQSILMETDSILRKMQNKIEDEEKKWRKELIKEDKIPKTLKIISEENSTKVLEIEKTKSQNSDPDEDGKDAKRNRCVENESQKRQTVSRGEKTMRGVKMKTNKEKFMMYLDSGHQPGGKISEWARSNMHELKKKRVKFKLIGITKINSKLCSGAVVLNNDMDYSHKMDKFDKRDKYTQKG